MVVLRFLPFQVPETMNTVAVVLRGAQVPRRSVANSRVEEKG